MPLSQLSAGIVDEQLETIQIGESKWWTIGERENIYMDGLIGESTKDVTVR